MERSTAHWEGAGLAEGVDGGNGATPQRAPPSEDDERRRGGAAGEFGGEV